MGGQQVGTDLLAGAHLSICIRAGTLRQSLARFHGPRTLEVMATQHRVDEEPDIEVLVEIPAVDDTSDALDEFDDPQEVEARRAAAESEVAVGGLTELDGAASEVSDDAAAVATAVRRQLGGEDVDDDDDAPVRPRTSDELTCFGCFLIVHVSRLADRDVPLCNDCI
jgi:hypothetical protein